MSKQYHQHHRAMAQHHARQARRKSSLHQHGAPRPVFAPVSMPRPAAQVKHAAVMVEFEDEEDADTETDEEPEAVKRVTPAQRRTLSAALPNSGQESAPSPLKRKRAMSMSELFDFPDSPPESEGATTPGSQQYHFDDIAALDESEDELDMERLENAELIDEREGDDMRVHKFHSVDDDKPFAYAPDGDDGEDTTPSEQGSRSEEYWLEDFDSLLNGASLFEIDASNSANNRHVEPTEDSLLEQDFFLQYQSSDDDPNDDDDDDDDDEDDDDRIGWDCFFADGESDSEHEMELEALAQQALAEEELAQAMYLTSQVMDDYDPAEAFDHSDGSTTDDEAPELLLQRSKTNHNPITPARELVKSNLTSCMKQTSFVDEHTPSKLTRSYLLATPTEVTTPNQAPLLGTWTRDSRRPVAVIDGFSTHSPAASPPMSKARPVPSFKATPATVLAAATAATTASHPKFIKQPAAYRRSDAMTAAMTSLDDIMYTNEFLVPKDDEESDPQTLSFGARPVIAAPGAFRQNQQSRANVYKEDSLKDEWFLLTSKTKASRETRKPTAVPVLGLGSESLSRKEKRRRKKLKTASAGLGAGLPRIGGSSLSLEDEYSAGEDDVLGVERAGLGMGPPLESLFSF